MAVSKRLRFEVLRRDNHTCRYCGRSAPEVKLTVDHVVPVTLGGGDDPSNLVAACVDCNSGKSSVPPDAVLVADVSQDALRWSRAMEQVAAIRQADRDERTKIKLWFIGVWNAWTNWRDETFELPDDARVAMRSQSPNKWRYFCGCCWNRIHENADMAADILQSEEK